MGDFLLILPDSWKYFSLSLPAIAITI